MCILHGQHISIQTDRIAQVQQPHAARGCHMRRQGPKRCSHPGANVSPGTSGSLGCHMGGGGGTTSGQRPGMPGDIPQGTGQPPQPRMTQHKCQALNFRSPCAAQLGEPSAPPGTDQVTWWYSGEDCSSPQGPAAFPWCHGKTAERLDSARPPWDSLPRVLEPVQVVTPSLDFLHGNQASQSPSRGLVPFHLIHWPQQSQATQVQGEGPQPSAPDGKSVSESTATFLCHMIVFLSRTQMSSRDFSGGLHYTRHTSP